MISYFANCTGPVNSNWIKNNGSRWAGGRIDISGIPDELFCREYTLPIMHQKDWERFATWLNHLKTENVLTFNEIISLYEKNNPQIQWHQKGEKS